MGAKLKAIWAKVNSDAADLWQRDKAFFVAFAALIAFVKFRDILINLMVALAKREYTGAQKQDAKLATQENQASTQADALAAQAAALPATETPVTEDWNKPK
jgi:hypothetical protein